MNFDNLSPLLQGKILSYLKDPEYRKLRVVCKKWDNSFRRDVGLGLRVCNSNWEVLQDCINRSGKLSHLILANMTMPLGQIIEFLGRIYLNSLRFDGIIPMYNIIWSLNVFRNLSKLTFDHALLETFNFGTFHPPLSLPSLEIIGILMTTGHENPRSPEDLIQRSGRGIVDFLSKIEYRKLKVVEIFCPETTILQMPFNQLFDSTSKIEEMTGLVRLLYHNRNTLQRFSAGPTPDFTPLIKWCFKPIQAFWKKPMLLVSLESLLKFPNDWDIMFLTQSYLKFIRSNDAYRHWSAIQACVSKSFESLVEVHLAGGGYGSSVSLSGFKKCTKLTTLEISLDDCYLEDVADLPKSVRTLSISGPLTQNDLRTIAVHLEKLEDLLINHNLPSTKYLFYGNTVVIPGRLTQPLVEDFLTLPLIHTVAFRNCLIEVGDVGPWLKEIGGVEAQIYPVKGYPQNTCGSMRIRVISRQPV